MRISVFEKPFAPTPVQELLGICPGNRVFCKREDLLPFSFGGNKVRKARYFYRDILEKGADVVMTYGSFSSNHCRIIANMAAAMELPCHIISPEENYRETPNSRMVEGFGAIIEKAPLDRISQTIDRRIAAYRKAGKHPYFIVGGGHGDLGTAAYVECYEEICDWERKNGLFFDYIFHVSGTGSTQAGLVCGQLAAKRDGAQRIVGLSNARTAKRGRPVVTESVRSWMENVHAPGEIAADAERIERAVIFDDSWRLEGYGAYNEQILETISHMMGKYGIPMDPTYVGKGFWGMQEYCRVHDLKKQNILFLHTGGTPLFFEKRQAEERNGA